MGHADETEDRPPAQVDGHASAVSAVIQYELDGAWVVVAHGAYDMSSLLPLREALESAASKHARVVVDASGLTFADSSFLNLLLRIHHTTSLRVAGPAPQLLRVLELTGANAVLDLRATVEDAVS
ncbi:STAS domain-containing protein [Streptomyces sp. NPDC058964]|uniref:STAS domain-containing protein n=1 Tax=Streptomyces sp. NPDC058964 TaxID=3346681 RepID=UPI00369A586B